MLRIRPGLHAALREAAAAEGVSLNDYCARKLAAPVGSLADLAGPAAVVERAAELFEEALIGVLVYGSWARDELADGSDVDVLIVLDDSVPITRELYRRWDEQPIEWDGRPVEPHFVHVPAKADATGGVWPEIAVDGIVLFERGAKLSAHLAGLRRRIASGRLVRKLVHGQPYWSEVA